MRTIRLKARCRVGMEMLVVIDAKAVKSSGASLGRARKISALFARERMKSALRILDRAFLKNNSETFCFRGPNAKMRFVFADDFRANRVTPFHDFSFHSKIDN